MTTTSSGGTMRTVAYVRMTPRHHFTAEQFTDCQIVERGARVYSIFPATGLVEELGHAA